jgi:hypothetical protein
VPRTPDLTEAISLFEALKYVEVGFPVKPALTGVAPAYAEQAIRDFADKLVYVEQHRDATGAILSILDKLKARLV